MPQPISDFCQTLGLKFPLIVAPMAGGPSSISLVSTVSESGSLGSFGAAYTSSSEMLKFADSIRSKTKKPFAINLFIPNKIPTVSDEKLKIAIQKTQKYRDELCISQPILTPPFEEDFDQQFEAVLRIQPNAFSFIFGVLPLEYMNEARRNGIITIGTATSFEEAYLLKETGVDAIVIQGVEAGGHRGIFDPSADDPGFSTVDLLREVQAKIRIPIIAAGGIMSSQDIKEMLRTGAQAVQMGTAFLATKEAGTSLPYKNKLLENRSRRTKVTRAYSGRLARGLINRFMEEMEQHQEAILPFPIQNKFTRDIRNAAVTKQLPEFLSLWAGSGQGDLWTGSAVDLIYKLFK